MSRFQKLVAKTADLATRGAANLYHGTRNVRDEVRNAGYTMRDSAKDRWNAERIKRSEWRDV